MRRIGARQTALLNMAMKRPNEWIDVPANYGNGVSRRLRDTLYRETDSPGTLCVAPGGMSVRFEPYAIIAPSIDRCDGCDNLRLDGVAVVGGDTWIRKLPVSSHRSYLFCTRCQTCWRASYRNCRTYDNARELNVIFYGGHVALACAAHS